MCDLKTENVRHFKKLCSGLQSIDRKTRKQTYVELERFLNAEDSVLSDDECRQVFGETYMHILGGFRDKSENVREQAIKFNNYFIINKLPINDFYLTYVFPVLIERIGTVEIVEESEEIRLQLVDFLRNIIHKYEKTVQLKPFLNDIVIILIQTVKDKYPAIKELSCQIIIDLSDALPDDFHMQAETLIKPVLTCFSHQRYKVRVSAVNAVGVIVLHGSYKALDESIGGMAEKLFDQIASVRRAVALNAARWLREYRDRYSFFYKILPLLLTGLNDEIDEVRRECEQLWEAVGRQYEVENEKDLKDQLDFLYGNPKFYPPNLTRPNLGCRTLVKTNVSKLIPPLTRELIYWQSDVRFRCSQLLCSMVHHCEEGITQNLQDLLVAMYSAGRDEDSRIKENILRAGEIIGCFVAANTWWEMVEAMLENGAHDGHLLVLYGLIKGSPSEFLEKHIETITKSLSEDNICCNRKHDNQLQLINCVKILIEKYKHSKLNTVGYNLFKIIVTLTALKHEQISPEFSEDLLKNLAQKLNLNTTNDLFNVYTVGLIKHVEQDAKLWTPTCENAQIFLKLIEICNGSFGRCFKEIFQVLKLISNEDSNAELKLKTLYILTGVFEKNDAFSTPLLRDFISEILMNCLVWRAGATAEAIRTMASCCLQHCLIFCFHSNLFNGEIWMDLKQNLLPLLISLTEDGSYRSRDISIECLVILKENCCRYEVWDTSDTVAVYPEILKRLDDPIDKVRWCALKNLPKFFENSPSEFRNNANYRPHHELIIDTLLTHFDDEDVQVQRTISECLEVMGGMDRKELVDKLEKHRPLLHNKPGCDDLLKKFRSLDIV